MLENTSDRKFAGNFLRNSRGIRCRDRMAVGFTTTYAITAYHH